MRQEIVSYVNSLEETRNMLLAPFGQLVPPLPLKSLDRVLLPVRLLHVSLLQHPTGKRSGDQIIMESTEKVTPALPAPLTAGRGAGGCPSEAAEASGGR